MGGGRRVRVRAARRLEARDRSPALRTSSPGEVEELLVSHPAIADAAAIGVRDDEFGQRLRVFVVLRDGRHATADQLQAYVKVNLARYKVPRDVMFLDELPRPPTGKILKRELAARTY